MHLSVYLAFSPPFTSDTILRKDGDILGSGLLARFMGGSITLIYTLFILVSGAEMEPTWSLSLKEVSPSI